MWGPDDPGWQHHNDLMRRHLETRKDLGVPVVTSDDRPATSPYSVSYEGGMTVTLAVPGFGAVVITMREFTRDGRLDWRGCRLTAR